MMTILFFVPSCKKKVFYLNIKSTTKTKYSTYQSIKKTNFLAVTNVFSVVFS